MEANVLKRRKVTHPDNPENNEDIYRDKIDAVSTPYFFSWAVIQIVLVHVAAGAFFGYSVGFVGPYFTFFEMSHECPLFVTERACKSLHHAECQWVSGRCEYSTACINFKTSSECVSTKCFWDEESVECKNQVGYTGVQNGIFAGSLIIGACFGSLGAAPLLSAIGSKRSFLVSGAVACVGAILVHVSTYNDNFILLNIGRFISGVPTGVLCCVSPMYVEDMVPLQYRQVVGVFFQVACTLSILFSAAVALGLKPYEMSDVVDIEMRRQVFCVPATVLSVLVVVAGIFMNESPHLSLPRKDTVESKATEEYRALNDALMKEGQSNASFSSDGVSEEPIFPAAAPPPFRAVLRPLITAGVMCIAQQMTGICAVMNYAPKIASVMGVEPLLGNLLVMAWNFAAVLISIPISFKFRADYSFIGAVFFASLSCLLTGIVILPSVGASDTVKRILSIVGIASFIGFFEFGMGSFFWALSQSIFPAAFRARGCSLTILFQFILNIIINVFFPISVENLSGGPSGVQDKGMGILFLFFGCVGILSDMYLMKFLRLWEQGQEPLPHGGLPEEIPN